MRWSSPVRSGAGSHGRGGLRPGAEAGAALPLSVPCRCGHDSTTISFNTIIYLPSHTILVQRDEQSSACACLSLMSNQALCLSLVVRPWMIQWSHQLPMHTRSASTRAYRTVGLYIVPIETSYGVPARAAEALAALQQGLRGADRSHAIYVAQCPPTVVGSRNVYIYAETADYPTARTMKLPPQRRQMTPRSRINLHVAGSIVLNGHSRLV
jgi:hypothetical protein